MKHIGTLLILVGLGLGYFALTINASDVLISANSIENQKDTLLTISGIMLFGGLLIAAYGARKGAKDGNLS